MDFIFHLIFFHYFILKE